MTDIAKHIRIFNATPDDEYVSKRNLSINLIDAAIKKKTSNDEMFALANNIIRSVNNPDLLLADIKDVAVRALKKHSTSFVEDGEQLQIFTCVFLAVIKFLEKAKIVDGELSVDLVLSLAVSNGLSFQGSIAEQEKLEALRNELQTVSQQKISMISEKSRVRKPMGQTPLTIPKENNFGSYNNVLNVAYGPRFDVLNTNAILDREELNILWWAIIEWSSLADRQFKELNGAQAAVLSGIEISKLLHRFPGKAHSNLACKYSSSADELSGEELLEQIGDLLPSISGFINGFDKVKNNPMIFPLFSLLTGNNENPGNTKKRSLHEWASRALLEGSMLNIDNLS
jgi:hypothetical protein